MKVCFWVSHIATVGGVQRVTSLIASALANYYDVTIITNDRVEDLKKNIYGLKDSVNVLLQPEELNKELSLPLQYKVIKRINKLTGVLNKTNLSVGEKIYVPHRTRIALIHYFNSFDFDVIIAVQGFNAILLATVADEITAKTIGWQHNSFEAYFRTPNEYFWNQDFLFKKYLKRLDSYVVLNEEDAKKISEAFKIKTCSIYNPKSFSSAYVNDARSKYFIAAGRFCKAKGFDILIDAVNFFVQTETEWKIFLVGDGEDRDKICVKIREYGLEKYFIMPGYTDDIQSYLKKASVLLLPSRWEGMPMIVLEALEMGLPIISFDIPAIKPLITDMREGIIVNRETGTKGFADAMKKISSNFDMRMVMASYAKKKAGVFDMDVIIPQWLKLINDVCYGKEMIR